MQLPSHLYLERLGIPYQRQSFPTDIEKGAASVARHFGFSERQMVKSLIFESDKGETVMVLLGGDQSAASSHLKKLLGSRDVRMAKPETVQAVTGYMIGSIPPFSWQPEGFRTFLEQSLLTETLLGVGAGQWGEEILLEPKYLVQAAKAEVVNLVDKAQPVR